MNALKTSFSYFDKLGSFCLSRLCRLKPIFPAVAAYTKAGDIYIYLFLYIYLFMHIYLYVLVWWRVISEARSLFRGDVGDVVLNCPDLYTPMWCFVFFRSKIQLWMILGSPALGTPKMWQIPPKGIESHSGWLRSSRILHDIWVSFPKSFKVEPISPVWCF